MYAKVVSLYVLSLGIYRIQAFHSLFIPIKRGRVSTASNKRRCQTYIVKTIPPLITSRTSRGTAPDQRVSMLSSFTIFAAQTTLFL